MYPVNYIIKFKWLIWNETEPFSQVVFYIPQQVLTVKSYGKLIFDHFKAAD